MSGYQYVVLRCVPRVDREEFVNVGVVLYCPAEDFLASGSRVDEQRLRALDPRVDVAAVRSALAAVESVCRGEAHVDFGLGSRATSYGVRAGKDDQSSRFGFLKAPRVDGAPARTGARRHDRRPGPGAGAPRVRVGRLARPSRSPGPGEPSFVRRPRHSPSCGESL